MTIFEVKTVTRKGVVYYEPIRGFVLFRHCSGNRSYVNGYDFNDTVKPLLLLHGIKEVNVI